MKIASVTPSNRTDDLIADALKSVVKWVDFCVIIDTHSEPYDFALEKSIAKDKLRIFKYRPLTFDDRAEEVRTVCINAAHSFGADFAVILDTDERLVLYNNFDIRKFLEKSSVDNFITYDYGRRYLKDRILRLPMQGFWKGRVHECFLSETDRELLPDLVFKEIPKTPEQLLFKFQSVKAVLLDEVKLHPEDARSWFYLGETLQALKEYNDSSTAYIKCSDINDWNEESAWACFRAAENFSYDQKWDKVIQLCSKGLTLHPGFAELAWFAAFAAYQSGDIRGSICWAKMSISIGHYAGYGKSITRVGFRHPPGLYEGPYDILRFALKQIGDMQGANQAERDHSAALAMRIKDTV